MTFVFLDRTAVTGIYWRFRDIRFGVSDWSLRWLREVVRWGRVGWTRFHTPWSPGGIHERGEAADPGPVSGACLPAASPKGLAGGRIGGSEDSFPSWVGTTETVPAVLTGGTPEVLTRFCS